MPYTPPSQPDPTPDTLSRGHEPDALNVRALVWLVAGFVALSALAGWGVWHLLVADTSGPRPADRPRSVARPDAAPPPGAPALQPSPSHDTLPWQDTAAMRAAEDRTFAAMGWPVTDGRPQIPDDVIRAVAARPATRPAPAPTTGGAP